MSIETIKSQFAARFAALAPFPAGDFNASLAWRRQRDALAAEAGPLLAQALIDAGGKVELKGGRGVHGELVQYLSLWGLKHALEEVFGDAGAGLEAARPVLRAHWHGREPIDESAAAAAEHLRQVRR